MRDDTYVERKMEKNLYSISLSAVINKFWKDFYTPFSTIWLFLQIRILII